MFFSKHRFLEDRKLQYPYHEKWREFDSFESYQEYILEYRTKMREKIKGNPERLNEYEKQYFESVLEEDMEEDEDGRISE